MAKDLRRYNRQISLPEVGAEGQSRLANARILVVGAGGLGCPALLYLAGAGIGLIGIADPDVVDISNLQRQVLFTSDDSGRHKAEAAREKLLRLNPEIKINAYATAVTEQNALGFFSDYDIVIDGTDNFSAKYLLSDAGVKSEKPVIYGAIQGFDGQVSVFDASLGPCYRCLYPYPPESAVQNCAEAGVIGALAGIVGTVQAMETIKFIIGDPSFALLAGKLWLIDTRNMETRILGIKKHPDCPVCSRAKKDIVLQSASPVCGLTIARDATIAEAKAMKERIFFDVRELQEWESGHIEGAHHLPLSLLQKNLATFSPPTGKTCVLYCQRGPRSQKAAELLLAAGFIDIVYLRGGFAAWREEV